LMVLDGAREGEKEKEGMEGCVKLWRCGVVCWRS
jgi:hypothetical protein